jgi:hypothetical protein
MEAIKGEQSIHPLPSVPWFGVRKFARALATELQAVRAQRDDARKKLESLGALPVLKLEARRTELEREIAKQTAQLAQEKSDAAVALGSAAKLLEEARREIVETEDLALLQEAGVYNYRHPLTDAVSYQRELAKIETEMKLMIKKDGGAVLAASGWTVNGSVKEGRAMVGEYSKLMLRAFNAEADTLVRWLKPYKIDGALERLKKVADTIARLGKTMNIRISEPYYHLRVRELELTADFLQKQAEQKEAERLEREHQREERKAQQEIENERARLGKERQHYANALQVLEAKGDGAGAARLREQLGEIDRSIESMDYRAANIRAGYVYLISNVGSFGENIVKLGMTRRLEPMDRIRELSDASVPFNFDVHALFFSKDAVGIEGAMHDRLADARVNIVNQRREFFRATPLEVKAHLSELAGEMLEFQEVPEALEYRQCLRVGGAQSVHGSGRGDSGLKPSPHRAMSD